MTRQVSTPPPVAEPQQRETRVVASLRDVQGPVERPIETEMQTEMRTEMAVEPLEQTSVSQEREVNHRRPAVEQGASVSVTQAAVEQAEPITRPMERVTPTETVSTSVEQVVESETTAPVQHTLMPVSEMAVEQGEPSVEARPVEYARTSRAMPAVQQVSVNEKAPSVIEQRVVKERSLRAFPQTQADYGWLSDTLWGRIEQLKRYPSLARNNHWEGKVLVEAVIQDDGAIIESQIAESSGHAVLDQQALMVLKQASPLTLKHPLGQRRVTILVPIIYRLDG
jgi:protein TonB